MLGLLGFVWLYSSAIAVIAEQSSVRTIRPRRLLAQARSSYDEDYYDGYEESRQRGSPFDFQDIQEPHPLR